jgi:thiamine-phosphate pyrophosphorylase
MLPGPRLYLVTDRATAGGTEALVAAAAASLAALPAGAAMLQVRERELGGAALLALSLRLRAVSQVHGCRLLINDRLDVALAADADGVHLPERGMPVATARAVAARCGRADLLVGVSTHGADGVAAAATAGADFVVCGPVWATPSKAGMGPPLGLDGLAAACAVAAAHGLPVYGLGGVEDAARAAAARAVGAHGVAAIRAFFASGDPASAAVALWRAVG